MSVYVLTPRAKADIFDIWSYIAEGNEGAANRVEQAIYAACAFVAEAPMRGHSRPDLTKHSLRFWTPPLRLNILHVGTAVGQVGHIGAPEYLPVDLLRIDAQLERCRFQNGGCGCCRRSSARPCATIERPARLPPASECTSPAASLPCRPRRTRLRDP
jgi:plasmid stabilization system protein ParE